MCPANFRLPVRFLLRRLNARTNCRLFSRRRVQDCGADREATRAATFGPRNRLRICFWPIAAR